MGPSGVVLLNNTVTVWQNFLACKAPTKSSLAPGPAQDSFKNRTLCPRAMAKCPFFSSVRPGAVTPSLGRLCQCPTTLWLKNLVLLSKLSLPWHNFRAILLALLTGPKTEGKPEGKTACPSVFPS